jgi:hypothetical protein
MQQEKSGNPASCHASFFEARKHFSQKNLVADIGKSFLAKKG